MSYFLEKLVFPGYLFLWNKVADTTIKTPVPETDTGRLVEYTKGRERTLSKELGKLAP
jgi:hypothetical protein